MPFIHFYLEINYADIITTITAISAIIIAIFSLRFTNKIARNSVKPLLSTILTSREDRCGLRLKNYGNGPAIIKKITFNRKDSNEKVNGYHKAFSIDKKYWKNYYNFSSKEYYLSPGESLYLGKIEKDFLKDKDKNYDTIHKIFDSEYHAVSVYVEYYDVFDNKMKPYHRYIEPKK